MGKNLKKSVLLKGDYFCTPDKPSTKLGYITKGLLRYFVIDWKGRDRTLGFGGEDVVVSSYSAVVWNQQDIKYIQTIEDKEMYICERVDFIALWESSDVIWKRGLPLFFLFHCLIWGTINSFLYRRNLDKYQLQIGEPMLSWNGNKYNFKEYLR